MNDYKKRPFIPAIQKTSALVALSLALLCFIITINFKIIEKSSSFDQKVVAAELMYRERNENIEKYKNGRRCICSTLKMIQMRPDLWVAHIV